MNFNIKFIIKLYFIKLKQYKFDFKYYINITKKYMNFKFYQVFNTKIWKIKWIDIKEGDNIRVKLELLDYNIKDIKIKLIEKTLNVCREKKKRNNIIQDCKIIILSYEINKKASMKFVNGNIFFNFTKKK